MYKLILSILLATSGLVANAKVIPYEDFAKKSQFNSFKISPDGKHVALTYEDEDQVKLAIMDLANKNIKFAFGAGGNNREIVMYRWATNSRIIMLNGKITGWLDGQNKDYKLVAGNIDGSKRNLLWDFQSSGIQLLSMLKDDPRHILVGKYHWSDKGQVKLQRMNIFSGDMDYVKDSPKPIGTSKATIRAIAVDPQDIPRIAVEFDPVDEDDDEDNVSYIHFKLKNDWKILALPNNKVEKPTVSPVGFNRETTKFYFLSDHDLAHKGLLGLFELDLKSQNIKFLYRHSDVQIGGGIFGPDKELIGVHLEPGYPDYYYLKDPEVAQEVAFHKSLRTSFKNEDITISSYTDDKSVATLRVASDRNPGDYYLFDRVKNSAKYIGSSMPHIKPKEMSFVEPFIFTARDGLKMYGQMTIPNGKELKDLPMVIYPHGGPYGVSDSWRWDRRAQLMANNGYLVVQLNFRGSGSYGHEFYEKGKGEWGGKMQDDLTDVTKWAIKQGYADKDRVCIHGVSYGGYASMQAVVKEPDLYKCSIPDAGPYELRLQWDEADSFKRNRAAGERYLTWMLGDNGEERIKERSPAYHVNKVKAALFLVHGSEDVRVPIENAYFLEEKLKEAGKPYQTLYKEDGHGFQKVDYRVELYDKLIKFLDKHIGK